MQDERTQKRQAPLSFRAPASAVASVPKYLHDLTPYLLQFFTQISTLSEVIPFVFKIAPQHLQSSLPTLFFLILSSAIQRILLLKHFIVYNT